MRKKYLLSLLSISLAVVMVSTTTLAWFTTMVGVNEDSDKELEANATYFAGGNGTVDNPYILNAPRHLYNLAWLQDLGYFDGENKKYFKVTTDIDMSSIGAIPPIGIDAHPFISTFDGNGKTIKNVSIDTSIIEFDVKPSNTILSNHTTDTVTNISAGDIRTTCVGLFGKIASINDDETTITEGVSNFNIDNCIVNYRLNSAISGIIAGYVDGNLTNVGVSKSSIKLAKNAYGNGEDKIFSKYTLIGDLNEETTGQGGIEWEDKPGAEGIGFGGSIDIMTAIRRLNYIQSKLGYTKPSLGSYYTTGTYGTNNIPSNDFHVVFRSTNTNSADTDYRFNWSSPVISNTNTKVRYADLLLGSYFPINVDLNSMGLNSADEFTNSIGNTNTYYNTHTEELIGANNTGYFVGGGTTNQGLRFRVQYLSDAEGSSIYKSLGYNNYKENNKVTQITYDPTKALFLYKSDKEYAILDDENSVTYKTGGNPFNLVNEDVKKYYFDLGLKKYTEVKKNLATTFENKNLYGMRFMNKLGDLGNINVNTDTTIVAKEVILNGEKKQNYMMMRDSINFSLFEDGILTFACGTYYSQPGAKNYTFFKLTRNAYNEITNIELIDRVSIVNNKPVINSYQGTLVYNESGSRNFDFDNAVYYYELPLPKGEYCMANINGNTPYIMYLDIGANGETIPTYKAAITGIDFVNLDSDAIIPFSANYNYSLVFFSIKGEAPNEVVLYFIRKDKNTSSPNVEYNDDDGITVTPIGETNNATKREQR